MRKQYHDIIIDYVVFQCISDISSRRFCSFMFSARNLECSDVLSLESTFSNMFGFCPSSPRCANMKKN